MADERRSDRSTILSTGWRVRGEELLAQLSEGRDSAPAEDLFVAQAAADPIFAVDFTLPRVTRGRTAAEAVLDAATEDVRQTWPECPRFMRDGEVHRPAARYGGLAYRTLAENGRGWRGDLVWRSAHPTISGAPITTRVCLEERPDFVRVRVRVVADDGIRSVRGYVGAGRAQPLFLRKVGPQVEPTWMGAPVRVQRLRSGDVADFVSNLLEDSGRRYPVVVLSPLEEGGYVVAPDELLWDLFGRARLHLLEEPEATFRLTDAVGDPRMSCFHGAVRCYFPDWSRHDDPYAHPLLLGDRLADPVMRGQWMGEVGMALARSTELPDPIPVEVREAAGAREASRVASDRPPPPTVDHGAAERPVEVSDAGGPVPAEAAAEAGGSGPAGSAGSRPAPSPAGAGTPALGTTVAAPASPDLLPRILDEVEQLVAHMTQLLEANSVLANEVERLRTLASVRSASTNAIERRIGRLESLVEASLRRGEEGAEGSDAGEVLQRDERDREAEGVTLVQVVRDVSDAHADALLVLPAAEASAAASPYEDPERVRAILEAMATVSRRRMQGTLGRSLREAFSDLGIDYRSGIAQSTPARLRQQYAFRTPQGDPFQAEEHIALGSTYDPRRCLRIYFSSRVPEELRFVVGHVGRHFEVMSST